MNPLVSIIFPTRNESLLISEALTSVAKYAEKLKISYEILVVLNGITDETEKIVNSLSDKLPRIKILHSSPPGYGEALRKGFLNALGEYVIVFNVDFYDLLFIDLAKGDMLGKDLIIGSKRASWSSDRRPIMRRIITQGLNAYLRTFHGFKGSDTHGIKIIRSKVLKQILPQCKTKSGIFDTEFVIRIQREGFNIMDLPVSVEEKRTARFHNRLLQTPADLYDLAKALQNS